MPDRDESSSPPAAPLEYAGRAGVYNALETVTNDALAPGGGGPRQLLKQFDGDRERTAWYFAKQLTRRFDYRSLDDVCNRCGKIERDHAVVCWWRVELAPRVYFSSGHGDDPTARAVGRTFHTLCETCWGPMEKRFAAFARVERWSLRVLGMAWVLGIGLMVAANKFLGDAVKSNVNFTLFVTLLFATLLLVIAHMVAGPLYAAVCPRGIRKQMPRGVKFESAYDLLTRMQLADSSRSFGNRDAIRRTQRGSRP